jgi:asparagine synthase (glutamine-hydrolysing)
MCGIAGVFSVERSINAGMVSAVLRMLDRQIHRGPDDWGILIPEQAKQDPEIRGLLEPRGWEHVRTYPGSATAPAAVLGSRRLSILDLSAAGRMPMVSRNGRVAVTFNGEIYNFRELRTELARSGHTFQSNSDTEVLLHGYQQWGDELPTHLRGMCAFAVLDARRDGEPRLFLARDRFGIKPLYWARENGLFQFASEVRAILAAGFVKSEPEPRGLHGFLMYGSVPTPWTTVRGVRSLPAAESLSIDQSSYSYPRSRRYWALPVAGTTIPPDAVERTRALLVSAVREQLVSDVPTGVFLSGGMDSSAITALAARELQRPLTTLCVTFDEAELSEARYAKAVADQFRTHHIEVRIRPRDFVDELSNFFDSLDQPTNDGINSYFVAKAAKAAGLTVVLSGLGGDELFGGYPGFRSYPRLRAAMRVPMAPALCGSLGRALRAVGLSKFEKLEFLSEHPVLGPYLTIRGLFPPRRAAQLLKSGRLPVWGSEGTEAADPESQFGRLDVACYLQNQLLRDTDVFAMRHSVEVRVPFLDHRLAEWVFALPPSELKAGNQSKPLLAAAMGADYLQEVVNRPKVGFTFPMGAWIQGAWTEIKANGPATSSLVPDSELEAVASDHRRQRLHWSRPWALAVLRAAERRDVVPRLSDSSRLNRILLVLPQVYGSTGGIQTYNQGLLRGITEAFPRAEIHVASLNDGPIVQSTGVTGSIHFSGAGPRDSTFFRGRLLISTVGAALRARPDVIVTGHINILPFTSVVGTVLGVPNMLVAHGIEAWAPPWGLRALAQRVTRVLAVSHYTADRMRDWGVPEERIGILPNMVDGDVFRPVRRNAGAHVHTLLTVARLEASERYKGIDKVMEALRGAADRRPVRYVVAGTGNDLPRLRAHAAACGVSDLVEFCGFVPESELPALYSAADVFIMPSKKEGFGIVFVEALACGTQVIAGNQDGATDALMNGRWGRLVDPDDVDQIRAAIVDSALPTPDRKDLLDTYGFEPFRHRVREMLLA